MILIPENDGVDHINIYSKGKTTLGRWASNFTKQTMRCPEQGYFDSVEGYWYWLKTGKQHDILRYLHGAEAKAIGRTFEKVDMPENEFNRQILLMINKKIRGNPAMRGKLANSELPFAHYYVHQSRVVPAGYEWITEHWERIRKRLQGG